MNDNKKKYIAIGLPIGMGLGVSMVTVIGMVTQNIGLWMPLGVAMGAGLGLSLGLALSEKKKEKRRINNIFDIYSLFMGKTSHRIVVVYSDRELSKDSVVANFATSVSKS